MRELSRSLQIILLTVLAVGITLRLWGALYMPSLWLDEAISVRFAESPLRDMLLAVPRFDTHPPLYYIQLYLWGLLGSGDRWMLLNSVLLDLAVMLSLAVVVTRQFDLRAGCWAAAIWAVLPLAGVFAADVRMYPMVFLLTVWLWYLLDRRVTTGQAGGRLRLGTILAGVALTMTHGMGFFVVFFLWLHATVRAWRAQRAGLTAAPGAMVLDYLPVAMFAAYSLGISLFRQTEGLAAFDLDTIGIHLTIGLLGMEAPVPTLAGFLAAALLLIPPLSDARARQILLWLVLLPWIVLLVLSLSVKTVFMYRTIGLFLPFIAIALAVFLSGIVAQSDLGKRALAAAIVVLLTVSTVNSAVSFRKAAYIDIAKIWQQEAQPGAVLFVEGLGHMWGVSRYLDGAPDYSALEIQPPVRDGMQRLKQRLSGSWVDHWGLFGRADHLVLGDRQVWPYVPDVWPEGLAVYWSMSRQNTGCLRGGDSVLRSFAADGHHLVECRAASG